MTLVIFARSPRGAFCHLRRDVIFDVLRVVVSRGCSENSEHVLISDK